MAIPFRLRRAEWVAGAFLVATVAVALGAFFVVLRAQGYFERRYDYYVEFKEGHGISPGGNVSIAGIVAGQVEEVALTPENRVLVRFNVRARYSDRLRADSVVEVDSPVGLSGVLGGKGIVVQIGSADAARLAPGARLKGVDPESIMDLIARVTGGRTAEDLEAIVHNVRTLSDSLAAPEGPVNRLLADASDVVGSLNRGEGSVGKLLHDDGKLYDRMEDVATNAAAASARLEPLLGRVEGAVKSLEKAMARVDAATAPLPEATAALPGIAADLKALTAELGGIAGDLHEATPMVKELLGETDRVLADLSDVIASAKRFYLIRINLDDVPDGPVADAPGR
ncbi:MAG TPA: MlaD family protein [Myxococcota bacterium]|jgi:phospholipid/cholesterol/gamma-HCH transport system substrate-binding protein|nr:MlaD family protein [Myxococcota bacterium]